MLYCSSQLGGPVRLQDLTAEVQRGRSEGTGDSEQGAAENASRKSGRRWLKQRRAQLAGALDELYPTVTEHLTERVPSLKLTPSLASRLQVATAIAPGPLGSYHSHQSLPPTSSILGLPSSPTSVPSSSSQLDSTRFQSPPRRPLAFKTLQLGGIALHEEQLVQDTLLGFLNDPLTPIMVSTAIATANRFRRPCAPRFTG